MNIGFAGVSCTGKTRTSKYIHSRFPHLMYIPELKDEIFDYMNVKPFDLCKASNEDRAMFDMSRVEYQMKLEKDNAERGFIADSALPVMVEHLLFLSSAFISDVELTKMVDAAMLHTSIYYDLIIHLPYGRVPFVAAPHRAFTNPYMLRSMDAVLKETLDWCATEVYTTKTLEVKEILDKLREVKNGKKHEASRYKGHQSSRQGQKWQEP